MRIKATINVEYDVNPDDYHVPIGYVLEEAIQIIEIHSLNKAITEVMPWPSIDVNGRALGNQILKIKLEE